METITITTEYIKLQDLLKLAAVTATGAEHAKSLYLWHGEKQDDAHLQQAGALRFACAFAELVLHSTDPRLDVLKAAFEEE